MTTIRSISLTVFFVISDLLFLHLIYNCIQFVEALFPESAIANRPVADCLFRMVVGEETPDEGAVSVPKKLTIGYFRQDVEEMQGRSVLDEAISGSGRVGDLHHELEALQREMSDPDKADDMDRILDRFGHLVLALRFNTEAL